MKEGLALLLALVLASTTELSSHPAVAYLDNFKKKQREEKEGRKQDLLNQFLSSVNYKSAFLISSSHTMLFIGIQGKHGAVRSCAGQTVLSCSHLPVRTEALGNKEERGGKKLSVTQSWYVCVAVCE